MPARLRSLAALLVAGVLAAVLLTALPESAQAAGSTQARATSNCASTEPGFASCFSLRRTAAGEPSALHAAAVSAKAKPSGYGPGDLASAYKLPGSGGKGVTVAIVDAYDDPAAAADLAVYRKQYGLPACTRATGCLRILNQAGATSPLPAADAGWAGEESLDLDMVSAICPSCSIDLIEADSASDADLYAAEDTAASLARFVSNSWGGGEYSGQNADDVHFNHPGVAITASSGDNGAGASYPATSPYVTAVGGTSLVKADNARGWSETAWSGAGSGCSAYAARPAWQTVTTGCSGRAESDVSAVADPATGVAVYQTYGSVGTGGWSVMGGTSVAAPVIAAVYAMAGTPSKSTYPAAYPYAHQSGLFGVTSGMNGTCGTALCTAGDGWDGPTGLGTPDGVAAFKAAGRSTVSTTGPASGTASGSAAANSAPQLLGNPGFETGSTAPWTAAPGVISTNVSGQTSRTGGYFAWLDGYGSAHTDTLSQAVTIPAGTRTAELGYWLHVDTAKTTKTAAVDTLTVSVNGTPLQTFSNLDHASGYRRHSVGLAKYAGQSVTLTFTGTEGAGAPTSFLIDDTSLTAS